ncbi:MAG: hypothetical protein OEV59_04340 [Deltaproteobacteria bacterium]|nr:hypothetical protein [Deltaproteobacteria bacterium]
MKKAPKKSQRVSAKQPEPLFCSFDCAHAKAEVATSAAKSCMTFNAVFCKKIKRRVPKGTPCQA